MRFIDLTGQKFGKWTVIEKRHNPNEGSTVWLCKCECGTERVVRGKDLRKNKTTQCAYCGGNGYKHGMKGTRLYKIWANMLSRCRNPNEHCYKHYGGRGIVVCEEWNDSVRFIKWAQENGYNDNLTIERIDNNGNYDPSNCTWILPERQSYNRRNNHHITINSKTKLLIEWAQESGVSYSLIIHRIKNGWPPNLLLSPPNPHRSKRTGYADAGTKNTSPQSYRGI